MNQRCWPRRGEPWQEAEDRKLLRLAKRLHGKPRAHMTIGRLLGRTPAAVITRLSILRVCECRRKALDS